MPAEFQNELYVLIVENNRLDVNMLKGMLLKSPHGTFNIQTTDSLESACQLLAQDGFNVVLLDLNLPDSKGLDTLERLHQRFPHLPIVVNTGAYEDGLGLKAVTCGAQDYLIKGKYKGYGLSKSLYYAIERKKAENELEDAYLRLKDTQEQLVQVEKMNVVGELASGIAHEVKNPLATILYGVEFLSAKMDPADEQVGVTLKAIKDAAKRANDIIKDLLDFASLSDLQISAEDLHQVIEQSLILTKYQCDRHHIKVVKQFNANLPRIKIDKNRIEQVLMDVILNAIYAMEGGGTLTISTAVKQFAPDELQQFGAQDGQFHSGDEIIVIDVDDTGSGIPERNLQRIYDPFFTTRRAAGGVGLGLSMARNIMKNHGGIINVDNLKGGGARARLIFKV